MADEDQGVVRYLISKRWFKIGLVIILVLCICGYLFYRWSATPVSTTTVQSAVAETQTAQPTYQPLSTNNFSTEIPSGWQTTDNNPRETRVQIITYAPGTTPGQIAFVSDSLPSDGLAGVGDYILRTHNTTAYSRIRDPSLPEGAIVFYSKDPTSYTAFLTHGTLYASVSVSDLTAPDEALQLLAHTLTVWQWQ